jgi:hypothetical protein
MFSDRVAAWLSDRANAFFKSDESASDDEEQPNAGAS